MSNIIDLRPFIKQRQSKECKHEFVTVDETLPLLTCDACESKLCPFWYIRRLADEPKQFQDWWAEAQRISDRQVADSQRLQAEINHLTEVKNKLYNTPVGDSILGLVARKHRKARAK